MGTMSDALRYLAEYLDMKKAEEIKPLPARRRIPILISTAVPAGVIVAIDPANGNDCVVMVDGKIMHIDVSQLWKIPRGVDAAEGVYREDA